MFGWGRAKRDAATIFELRFQLEPLKAANADLREQVRNLTALVETLRNTKAINEAAITSLEVEIDALRCSQEHAEEVREAQERDDRDKDIPF